MIRRTRRSKPAGFHRALTGRKLHSPGVERALPYVNDGALCCRCPEAARTSAEFTRRSGGAVRGAASARAGEVQGGTPGACPQAGAGGAASQSGPGAAGDACPVPAQFRHQRERSGPARCRRDSFAAVHRACGEADAGRAEDRRTSGQEHLARQGVAWSALPAVWIGRARARPTWSSRIRRHGNRR